MQRTRDLEEGGAKTQTIDPATLPTGLEENNIVHFSGLPVTEDSVRDETFGIATKSIALSRKVEMYQWVQIKEEKKEKKLGGGTKTTTTYKYEKEWKSTLSKSSSFKKPVGHENPSSMPYEAKKEVVKKATLGAINLSQSTIGQINCYESFTIDEIKVNGDTTIKKVGNTIFVGLGTLSEPRVGDVRINYTHVPVQDISVVASLNNGTTTDYQASNNSIHLVTCGLKTAKEMFISAHENNKILAWVLRGLGIVLIFVGFRSIFKIFSVIGDVVPFIGDLIGMGLGLIAGLLTIIVSFTTIAIAWIFYRPILGISLLVIVGALIAFIIVKKKKGQATPEATA